MMARSISQASVVATLYSTLVPVAENFSLLLSNAEQQGPSVSSTQTQQ
jgi:hypothetical protein